MHDANKEDAKKQQRYSTPQVKMNSRCRRESRCGAARSVFCLRFSVVHRQMCALCECMGFFSFVIKRAVR